MDDNKFWDVVEQVDWRTLCQPATKRPYEIGQKRLRELLPTYKECTEFQTLLHQKEKELADTLYEWQTEGQYAFTNDRDFGLGDDGFNDLCDHIIGLGQTEFLSVLARPTLAFDRAAKFDFVESFSYCIPDERMYDSIEEKLSTAKQNLKDSVYLSVAHAEKDSSAQAGHMKKMLPWQQEELASILAESQSISQTAASEMVRLLTLEFKKEAYQYHIRCLTDNVSKAEKNLKSCQARLLKAKVERDLFNTKNQ